MNTEQWISLPDMSKAYQIVPREDYQTLLAITREVMANGGQYIDEDRLPHCLYCEGEDSMYGLVHHASCLVLKACKMHKKLEPQGPPKGLDLPNTEEKEAPLGFLEKAYQESINKFADDLSRELLDTYIPSDKPTLAFIRQELIHLTERRHALDEMYTALSDELRKAGFRLAWDEYTDEYVLAIRPACNEDDMNDLEPVR